MLNIRDLYVSYGQVPVLHGVSLEIPKGQIVTVLGANGAGKSTTIGAVAGLLPISRGSIEFDGDPHFVIGDRSLTASGEPFGGLVDEVVLYNRELDPKEIRAVMDGGIELAVRPHGNIVATWAYLKTAR